MGNIFAFLSMSRHERKLFSSFKFWGSQDFSQKIDFWNGPTPAPFCLFSFFSNTNFTEKLHVSAGLEGEHADHLTTTTALKIVFTLITGSTPRTYIVKSVKFPSIPRWKIWMGKVLYSTSPPELVTVVCYIQSLSFPLKLWSTKKVSFNEV